MVPALLARLMITPSPRATIFGASTDTSREGACTLAANSRSSVLASSCADGPNQANPALLTRMSTSPASSASRSASAGSPRSAPTNRAEPPPFSISATTAAPRSASRLCTMTVAPCAASCIAAALPIPDVAPVTSATLPSRSRTALGLAMTTPKVSYPDLDLSETAVDAQFGAGHEAAVIGGEKQSRGRDLFGGPHPVERNRRRALGSDRVPPLRRVGLKGHDGGGDRARAQGVEPDSAVVGLPGPRAGIRTQRGL